MLHCQMKICSGFPDLLGSAVALFPGYENFSDSGKFPGLFHIFNQSGHLLDEFVTIAQKARIDGKYEMSPVFCGIADTGTGSANQRSA